MKQTAIVTGGAKRLGKSIALFLAKKGYDIVLHYNHSQSDANSVVHEIQSMGRDAISVSYDLSHPDSATKLMRDAVSFCRDVSVLIHNASVFSPHSFFETTPAIFDENMTIHFKTPFFLTQAFAKYASSGQIVTLLDTRIATHDPTFFSYTLSKKALSNFTQLCARALGPKFRVNGICPGSILAASHEDSDQPPTHNPLQTSGSPDDITRAVGYLLDSPFVTGELLFIDGGAAVNF